MKIAIPIFAVVAIACGGGSSPIDSGSTSADSGQMGPSDSGPHPGYDSGPRPPVMGTPGVWEDVTDDDIHLEPSFNPADNFGVQDVIVDPARPTDVYAFICYQGVWRSTDYGTTWAHVSTGRGADVLDAGRPWAAAIDPDPSRDPSTPPDMYTVSGYSGHPGVLKSTDFGANWDLIELPFDIYSLEIDPYDSSHLIGGMHEAANMVESTDAGAHWHQIDVAAHSAYAFFVDTGDPATTRNTWLLVNQAGDPSGISVTRDAGAHFDVVESVTHAHGNAQIHQAAGAIYVAGFYGSEGHGVYRSTDLGAHFSLLANEQASDIVGTPSHLYLSNGGANLGGVDPLLRSASIGDPTTWSPMTAPSTMTNGAKRMAVTFDGAHYVIISGNWNGGIFRYVEP
jgi:hypothetical protein